MKGWKVLLWTDRPGYCKIAFLSLDKAPTLLVTGVGLTPFWTIRFSNRLVFLIFSSLPIGFLELHLPTLHRVPLAQLSLSWSNYSILLIFLFDFLASCRDFDIYLDSGKVTDSTANNT